MVIKDFQFKCGALVLARNTAIEKALNQKMHAQYIGPLVVIARNRGGAYLLCELDGSVLDRPVAAFRLVPYFACSAIDLPNKALDIEIEQLQEMQESRSQGDDDDYEEDRQEESEDDASEAEDDD